MGPLANSKGTYLFPWKGASTPEARRFQRTENTVDHSSPSEESAVGLLGGQLREGRFNLRCGPAQRRRCGILSEDGLQSNRDRGPPGSGATLSELDFDTNLQGVRCRSSREQLPQRRKVRASRFTRTQNSVLSTIDEARAERASSLGHKSESIVLQRLDVADVFRSHGVPYFLKVDVEGVDQLVLEGLKLQADRPQYISVEF